MPILRSSRDRSFERTESRTRLAVFPIDKPIDIDRPDLVTVHAVTVGSDATKATTAQKHRFNRYLLIIKNQNPELKTSAFLVSYFSKCLLLIKGRVTNNGRSRRTNPFAATVDDGLIESRWLTQVIFARQNGRNGEVAHRR
jgi:hypothetical protein